MTKSMKNKALFVFGLFILSACVSSADHQNGEEYKAHFSDPKCKDYAYAEEIIENDGDNRQYKFGNAYCTHSDYQDSETKEILNPAFIEEPLKEILSDKEFDIESINIVSYYYSFKLLDELICNKAKDDDFTVNFLAQSTGKNKYGYAGFEKLKECLGNNFKLIAVGCNVFDQKCNSRKINTMHPKLLSVRGIKQGEKLAHIMGGSANLRNNMSMDYDDMIHFKTRQGSYIDHAHTCMFDTMITTSIKRWNEKRSNQYFRECAKKVKIPPNDGIRVYFSPPEGRSYLGRLIKAIDRAETVRVAIQVLGDEALRDALIRAVNRGANVMVLADNGWYYLTFGEAFTRREAFDWGDKDSKNFERFLRPVMKSKAQVRFLETNFDMHRVDNNYMHLRFIITSQKNKHTIFTGSSHFKAGALLGNYENQYLISDQRLAEHYIEFFDQLWRRSLPERDLPSAYTPSRFAKEKLNE